MSTPPLVFAGTHGTDFQNDALSSFAPLNSAIGTQLAILPFSASASGYTLTFAGGVLSTSQQSFGPILAEKADTIGRHKLFVGVSYQYFAFGSVDGVGLKDIPATLTSMTEDQKAARDVIQTNTRIDLHITQVTAVATFGITKSIDVSVAIPLNTVHMGVTSAANIIANSVEPGDPNPSSYPHLFAGPCNTVVPQCVILSETFTNQRNVTGIGDVVFRGKWKIRSFGKDERWAVAAEADLRTPTGNANDFLGSGTWGFAPFAVISYRARVSPHVNIGYMWNGDSILAGTINTLENTSTKGHLPNEFFYTFGADIRATNYLTLDLDFLGQSLFSAPQLSVIQVPDQGNIFTGVTHTFPTITQSKGTVDVNNLSFGLKFEVPKTKLVLTGNVLYQVNDGGLRARVVPLAGISYTFF
jgi:hypothetical protein